MLKHEFDFCKDHPVRDRDIDIAAGVVKTLPMCDKFGRDKHWTFECKNYATNGSLCMNIRPTDKSEPVRMTRNLSGFNKPGMTYLNTDDITPEMARVMKGVGMFTYTGKGVALGDHYYPQIRVDIRNVHPYLTDMTYQTPMNYQKKCEDTLGYHTLDYTRAMVDQNHFPNMDFSGHLKRAVERGELYTCNQKAEINYDMRYFMNMYREPGAERDNVLRKIVEFDECCKETTAYALGFKVGGYVGPDTVTQATIEPFVDEFYAMRGKLLDSQELQKAWLQELPGLDTVSTRGRMRCEVLQQPGPTLDIPEPLDRNRHVIRYNTTLRSPTAQSMKQPTAKRHGFLAYLWDSWRQDGQSENGGMSY